MIHHLLDEEVYKNFTNSPRDHKAGKIVFFGEIFGEEELMGPEVFLHHLHDSIFVIYQIESRMFLYGNLGIKENGKEVKFSEEIGNENLICFFEFIKRNYKIKKARLLYPLVEDNSLTVQKIRSFGIKLETPTRKESKQIKKDLSPRVTDLFISK